MASLIEITSFAEYVAEKRQDLEKLHDLYEKEFEAEVVTLDSEAEDRILNAQYLKLIVEIEILKDLIDDRKKSVKWLPEDPDFLYEWTKHKLKTNIEDLQNALDKQAETNRQLIAEEKELLKKLENEDNNPIEDLLEEEKYLSEVVQQIHRKLIKRLRRLARCYLSSQPDKNSTDINSEKSFYKVLQKFIVELKQNSPAANLSEEGVFVVDESTPKKHLQFLLDSGAIEIIDQDPLTLSLKRAIE